MGGSRSAGLLVPFDPDSTGDLEPRVPPLCLSFLICTMGFGLVDVFKGPGQRCPVFGDFDFQKIFALTPACTLPCLSFPGKFPLRPGTQL